MAPMNHAVDTELAGCGLEGRLCKCRCLGLCSQTLGLLAVWIYEGVAVEQLRL